MRKYRGKYPSRINSVGGYGNGVLFIETNEGGKYFLHARDVQGRMPKPGEDIYTLPFQRAQPMQFVQQDTTFLRITDGEEWPFVSYPQVLAKPMRAYETVQSHARRQFIRDMAQQNILVRFKEGE